MTPIKVFIVDDSAVVRQVLSQLLATDPGIRVIGTASDPIFARQRLPLDWPDVIILDVEMPRMDGLTFLRLLMAERPTPVIICSSLTEKGAETTLQALSAGAVDVVTKPKVGLKHFLEESATHLIRTVKAASLADPRRFRRHEAPKPENVPEPASSSLEPAPLVQTTEQIVAIGASTGGVQALETVLTALPRVCPGIVIVQHMPPRFTASLAARLNALCQIEVKEAANHDRVLPGRALIAPGGYHLRVKRSGAQYHVEVLDGPTVNRHRPSVDVLFRSVARHAGRNALGIILTGMGDDGARGLKEMHDAGARTLAQDEASCVVYGMPKEAVKLGGVARSLPLSAMAHAILQGDRKNLAAGKPSG